MIRKAGTQDRGRLAEIEIFNYRLNFYPIFKNDAFYFGELQVSSMMEQYDDAALQNTYVYDDGVVKGFVRLEGTEVKKLFVEPVLQGQNIGGKLLTYAVVHCGASSLWALEKNTRAVKFYLKNGFRATGERRLEDETTEYLVKMER